MSYLALSLTLIFVLIPLILSKTLKLGLEKIHLLQRYDLLSSYLLSAMY